MKMNIEGWLTPHEGIFLEKAARVVLGSTGEIVEIGSFLGKSTIHLAKGGDIIYAVDPHKGEFSGGKVKPTLKIFLSNLKKAGVDRRVVPIVKTSKEASKKWKSPIKLLFIDGLHDFDHASEDFSLWSPFVVDRGIIAMHDAFCGWEGAGQVAMRELIYNPDFGEIGVVGSILYGIRGKGNRILKLFRQCVIELCQSIYKMSFIPKRIQFILVHKLLRILLLNRFSSIRNPAS